MSKTFLSRKFVPKRTITVAAVLVVVSGLAACSDDDSSSGSTDPTSVGSEAAGSSAPPTSIDFDDVPESMVQMFAENSIFSTFAELVALTDLAPLFEADGEITIFIPGNKAFDKLPSGALEKLKDPQNKEVLTRLLSYHMLDGKVSEMEIVSGTLVMKSGDSVEVEVGDQVGYLLNIKVNGNPVAVGDLLAGKSVAHILGTVLVPPGMDLAAL